MTDPRTLQARLPNLHDAGDLVLAILSLCVYREARGEPLQGKIAVAKTVCNRASDPKKRWPTDPVGVILEPLQFSSFNSSDPNVAVYPRSAIETAWTDSIAAAVAGMSAQRPDPSGGANHYFAAGIPTPKWADMAKRTATIGRHTFFRLAIAAAFVSASLTAEIGGLRFFRL